MATDLHEQGLLLLRQALDNSTANFRPGHWKGEIRTFRREIKDQLKESPSLKPYILEIFDSSHSSFFWTGA